MSLIAGISSKVWNAGGEGTIHSNVGEIPFVVCHGLREQV